MIYSSDIGYKISIITPTYNSQKTIEENIKSVLSQKFTNWEQIIIDNCSTDKTLEIVNKFRPLLEARINSSSDLTDDAVTISGN